ncbi:MAG TPA: hypothetical protein VNA16_01935 [Abditibacteriaceae bacterium]|nr:hypothetical protein [Abditibacteriaceae bacterium]
MLSDNNARRDDTDGNSTASDSTATETGSAGVNAVYPGSSGGSSEVTDADVADMNADSSSQSDTGDAVPGVRSG